MGGRFSKIFLLESSIWKGNSITRRVRLVYNRKVMKTGLQHPCKTFVLKYIIIILHVIRWWIAERTFLTPFTCTYLLVALLLTSSLSLALKSKWNTTSNPFMLHLVFYRCKLYPFCLVDYAILIHWIQSIFSSSEPKAHWWAYRIGRPPSSVVCLSIVCRPHCLNIFSSDTTRPIKVKFHMELLWDGRTKVC